MSLVKKNDQCRILLTIIAMLLELQIQIEESTSGSRQLYVDPT